MRGLFAKIQGKHGTPSRSGTRTIRGAEWNRSDGRNGSIVSSLGRSGAADVVPSILSHLQSLLNTRQGESQTVPDYGIMDFSDLVHVLPKGIDQVERAIQETIEKFEPRLTHVRVLMQPEQDAPGLHFSIAGRLRDEPGRSCHFQSRLGLDGKFTVN